MSAPQVLLHEVADVMARLPRWLGPFTNWATAWAIRGPRWLPPVVRKLPLHLACCITMVYVRGWL